MSRSVGCDDSSMTTTSSDPDATGLSPFPRIFIVDGEPLASLRGTIIVLKDAGFTDDEVIDWLLSDEETMGRSPIAALLAGHKSEVRRIARTLA